MNILSVMRTVIKYTSIVLIPIILIVAICAQSAGMPILCIALLGVEFALIATFDGIRTSEETDKHFEEINKKLDGLKS